MNILRARVPTYVLARAATTDGRIAAAVAFDSLQMSAGTITAAEYESALAESWAFSPRLRAFYFLSRRTYTGTRRINTRGPGALLLRIIK